MSDVPHSQFVMDVLAFVAAHDIHGMLIWRTDGAYAPITFWVNSNDILCWGCADCVEINEETFPLLQQSVDDCKAIDSVCGAVYGCDLFACRVSKMRPQGAAYPKDRALWPLFDACGPEREVGLGNPLRPGDT